MTPESNCPVLVKRKYNITQIWTTSRAVLGIHVNTGSPDRLIGILQPKSGVESSNQSACMPRTAQATERFRDLVMS